MVRKSSGQDPRSCAFPPLRRLPLMLCRLLRSICCLALLSAAGCLVTGSGEGPEVARWLLHRCGAACSMAHSACNVRFPWAAIKKGGRSQARIPAPEPPPLFAAILGSCCGTADFTGADAACCCILLLAAFSSYKRLARVSCSFSATSKHLWRLSMSFSAVIIASLHQLFAENLGSCSASHRSIG